MDSASPTCDSAPLEVPLAKSVFPQLPHWFRVAALSVGLIFLTGLAESAARLGLWQVVSQCLAVKSLTGLTFPCAEVSPATASDVGSILLKSPRSPTEYLLTPAVPIAGLEDPQAAAPSARSLWEKAWEERQRVADAAGVAVDRIGLAVNSRGSRTQDEFHIHIECTSEAMIERLDRGASTPIAGWQATRDVVGANWIETLSGADLTGIDIMSQLLTVPTITTRQLPRTSIGVIPGRLQDGTRVIHLVVNTEDVPAESLLDHDCAM